MIRHVVVWKLKAEAEGASSSENAKKMKQKLESLVGQVPEIKRLEFRINGLANPTNADVMLVVDLVDWAALDRYQKHPAHVKVAEFVGKVKETRVAVDFEL